jgi:hypothetical protein
MSNYASNPAGLGVGKRYGALSVGGVAGTYRGEGSQREIIFELSAGEITNGVPFTVPLPADYLVQAILLEVETAFAASSTANIAINGGAALSTPMSLATKAALANVALTGLANLSGTASVNLVLTGNANAIASTTGKARILVQYKAI